MKKSVVTIILAIAGLFMSSQALANHFRGGNITWKVPDPVNAPLTVQFTVTSSFDPSTSITVTDLKFGDGASNGNQTGAPIGSGVDSVGVPYTTFQYTATHTYLTPGPWSASFNDCCRVQGLVNGAGANYTVRTIVNLQPGNTASPIIASPPVIQLQVGNVRSYAFPMIDPDLDPLTCRFGATADSGLPGPALLPAVPAGGATPSLSATPSTCVLTWDLTQAVAGQRYVVHVVSESTHGGQISSSAVDLIVEMIPPPPPDCTGGGSFVASIGQALSIPVVATHNVAGNLTLAATGMPAGATLSPVSGTSSASPFATTFDWTPQPADAGSALIVLLDYTNSLNHTGTCFLAIQVPQCAGFGQPCTAGLGQCAAAGTTVCVGPGPAVCNAIPGVAQPETCNTLDDDCDGAVDNGTSGAFCATGLLGACSTGTTSCTAGVSQCVPDFAPAPETCDASDDDCDGTTDEGFNLGGVCTNGVGTCQAAGVFVCNGGGTASCNAVPGAPGVESCNDADDDCDGAVDDGNPGGGGACVSGLPGVCATGAMQCAAGALGCVATTLPGEIAEICGDGLDNDCDAVLDNTCDSDGDGVTDPNELAIGTDPTDADSDDDGVIDGDEPELDQDTDGDGLINALDPDSDDDGLLDGTEMGFDCAGAATDVSAGHCVADGDAGATTTDPLSPDTDGGGVSDGSEDANLNGVLDAGETDPTAGQGADDASGTDTDGDGLTDAIELFLGTDPNDADSDDDGVIDSSEDNLSQDTDGDGLINALDVDSDNDGLFDGTEMGFDCSHPATDVSLGHCVPDGDAGATVTSPVDADTDGGGVSDGSEDANLNGVLDAGETDPTSGHGADDATVVDTDGDGLSDLEEAFLGTLPNDADTDDDGVIDGLEPNASDDTDGDGLINALDFDSDGDGLFDGTEMGFDCSDPATDTLAMHCTPDGDGGATKTNPLLVDTDGGGVSDGAEDTDLDGVLDAGETDPNDGSDDVVPECLTDADCGDATSGQVCDDATQVCIDGCRGTDGNGCPAGEVCTSVDATIGQCVPEVGCDDDADCGDATSGKVCDDTTQICIDGCRGMGGNGCPIDDTCTSTDATIGQCIPVAAGCTDDSDCGGASSGEVCDDTTQVCVPGCRGSGGNGCPSGEECTSTGPSIGQCIPAVDCTTDSECGSTTSGKVCTAGVCVDGCRATGNGCANDGVCSSTNADAGTCSAAEETGIYPEGNGLCSAQPGRTGGSTEGVLAGLLAAVALAARKRRRARA